MANMHPVLAFSFFVLIQSLTVTVVAGSACSTENRTADVTACLDGIHSTLVDTDAFWFGTHYATLCPQGPAGGVRCMNPRPDHADSIWSRLNFSSDAHNPNLDRYLHVKFDSYEKNYTGCGVTFMSDGHTLVQFEIDPLSTDVHEPWFLKHMPHLVWSYDEGDYFTLIMYDVGFQATALAVYANIPGNDIANSQATALVVYANIPGNDIVNAQVIVPYSGPMLAIDRHTPYVFLLYKHSAPAVVTDALADVISGRVMSYSPLEDFLNGINLQGPVAVSWVTVTGDIYAANMALEAMHYFTCPIFSSVALHEGNRTFVPMETALTVWIDVHFYTQYLEFNVCCNSYMYSARMFDLNPIGDPLFKTAEVRSEANVSYSLRKMGPYEDIHEFQGEMHALLIVDPDVPFPTAGTQEKPLLHGMIVNIMDGNMTSGETVAPYRGPGPPDYKPHYYYFLLYRQTNMLNASNMLSYVEGSCAICLYNIEKLVSDENLSLVGASWMHATTDEYIIKRNIDRNSSVEAEQCAGMAGYASPCPTPGPDTMTTTPCDSMYDTDCETSGSDFTRVPSVPVFSLLFTISTCILWTMLR